MGKPKKYYTEEERIAARKEKDKRNYQKNREKILLRKAKFYQDNKEYFANYRGEYIKTQQGRAKILIKRYKQNDEKYGRGECTLTADWFVKNIFSQPCHYCGKTDWHELGCDRIDNSLPHTPDNVVPCCFHCNCKKGVTPYDEFMKKIGKIA